MLPLPLNRIGASWWYAAGLLLAFCTRGVAQSSDLLLVGSDDATIAPIRARLENVQHETRAAWEFWTGSVRGRLVTLTRSEGDPLNAIAATTLAIRNHHPRLVIVFGVARPLDPELQPGNIVVSRDFVAYDGSISPVADDGAGSHPLSWEKLPHLLMAPGETELPAEVVAADVTAAAAIVKIMKGAGPAVLGSLGSANQVNQEADRIAWIRKVWHASTEDAESAHVAYCARLLSTPAVGFRVIARAPAEAGQLALKVVEGLP